MFKTMIILTTTLLMSTSLLAGTIVTMRSTKLNADLLSKIQKGEVENTVVEFIEGDRLPINIRAEGDLFESVDSNPTFVEIKKHFYLKIMKTNITISFDGQTFKSLKDSLDGTLTVNASANEGDVSLFPANIINIVFSAFTQK